MKDKLNKLVDKLSQPQRIISLAVTAVSLFLITYPIAKRASNIVGKNIYERTSLMQDPFYFERTWYVWLIYVIVVGSIAFFLFKKPSSK